MYLEFMKGDSLEGFAYTPKYNPQILSLNLKKNDFGNLSYDFFPPWTWLIFWKLIMYVKLYYLFQKCNIIEKKNYLV